MTGSTKPSDENAPLIIGVGGGSGSGKTFFAKHLKEALGAGACEIVYQDNFYFDQSSRFDFDGGAVNFDHPDAIDFKRLALSLRELKTGRETQIPLYDFKTHRRETKTQLVSPRPVILVDGILIFHDVDVRSIFDDRIYFDTPESLRFQRRLERDVVERGRTPEGVRTQFLKQVKPMHDLFVEPSKAHANRVVSDLDGFDEALKTYIESLSRHCSRFI